MAPYELRVQKLVDLTKPESLAFFEIDEKEMACSWKEILAAGGTPPTWLMADFLRGLQVDAVRVPSVAVRGGVNIVVWELSRPTCDVRVIDPDSALPVDQASWPPRAGPDF